MSARSITLEPNPPLRQKAEEVKKKADLSVLIPDMFASMREAHGIGLAAPQIGTSLRVFVIEPSLYEKEKGPTVFINPMLKKKSFKRVAMEEGCLSVPRIFGEVKRPASVTVEAYDRHWKKFRISAKELIARVLQHELDHLDGILFIDNAMPETLHEYTPETPDDAQTHQAHSS